MPFYNQGTTGTLLWSPVTTTTASTLTAEYLYEWPPSTGGTGTAWLTTNTTYTWTTNSTVTGSAGTVIPERLAQETPERRALYDQVRTRRREYAEYADEIRLAEARAVTLLREALTEEQRHQHQENGYFEVISNLGHRYRIRCRLGLIGNVDRLTEDGQASITYCAHPDDVPDSDAFLAQKLALETDEEGFLAIANVHSRRVYR